MRPRYLALVLALAIPGPESFAGEPIRDPPLVRRPSASELLAVYPASAMRARQSGAARIRCRVTAEGELEACEVSYEDPVGAGFGEAALKLAPRFQMAAATPDGRSVKGGVIELPIFFSADGPPVVINVLTNGPWAQTPTAEDVAAAFPAKARGKADRGQVVLRCKVRPTGVLTDCASRSEEPKGAGFKAGALKLADKFRLQADPGLPKNTYVDVPIGFGGSDTKRVIDKPLWMQVPGTGPGEAFPQKALDAGLRTGVGSVRCEVTRQGRLTGCASVGEDPIGYGFGDAALRIAATLAMNPWTADGRPVEGMHVELPIRMARPATAP